MGATPEVKSDVQDELAAAFEASRTGNTEPEVETGEEVEAPAPETKKEDPKPAESKKGGDKTEETPPKKEDEDDGLFDIREQNRELRQMLRMQNRQLSVVNAKLQRLEKASTAASKKVEEKVDAEEEALFGAPAKKVKDDEAEATPAESLSPVEKLQAELVTVAQVKGPIMDTLLETMEMNTKYEDVRSVCSQANFDDIFEAIGEAVAAKEGRDASIAALEAEVAVWKMANPYRYMYDLIKKYHPKYQARQPEKKEDTPKKEPAKAPSSVADVPGKGSGINAWTSARIDELPESELDKVPADIYDKYMRGELD